MKFIIYVLLGMLQLKECGVFRLTVVVLLHNNLEMVYHFLINYVAMFLKFTLLNSWNCIVISMRCYAVFCELAQSLLWP